MQGYFFIFCVMIIGKLHLEGIFFLMNRTLALKETSNSTKHLKKNENYDEILEKPFIFNLQTVSTARCAAAPP